MPPFLVMMNLSLNTLVMFLFAVEKLEKYARRTRAKTLSKTKPPGALAPGGI